MEKPKPKLENLKGVYDPMIAKKLGITREEIVRRRKAVVDATREVMGPEIAAWSDDSIYELIMKKVQP